MKEELLLCVNISVVKQSHKKVFFKTCCPLLGSAIAGRNLDDTFFSLEDILRLLKTILL